MAYIISNLKTERPEKNVFKKEPLKNDIIVG